LKISFKTMLAKLKKENYKLSVILGGKIFNDTVQSLFGIQLHGGMSPDRVSNIIKNSLYNKFQLFWKDEINDSKIWTDNISHNKLRLYCQLKSCFAQEPYISKVTNRNQRSWISRLRTSAHSLGIERGRYSNVSLAERYCVYCVTQHNGEGEAVDRHGEGGSQAQQEVDSELHFLAICTRFKFSKTARVHCTCSEHHVRNGLVKNHIVSSHTPGSQVG
jgi:hypothetical protein